MGFTAMFKLALAAGCFLTTCQCLPQPTYDAYTGPLKESEEFQYRALFRLPFLTKVCENKYDNYNLVRLANGHVYHFSSTEQTWANSKSACEAMGMRLVTFDDLYESLLVQVEMIRRGLDYLWFALDDPNNDKLYTWTYSGQRITFSNWLSSEPSDPNQCGIINTGSRLTSSGWDAHICTHTHYYACEIPQECDKYVTATFQPFTISTL